jgi:type IV pilus assembly protein PilA
MFDLAELREKRAEGDKGFTLIELLVVVVIIGILIAIAIPVYLNYKKGASDKSAQSDLRNAINTLEQCNTDNGIYPTAFAAAGALTGCANQTIKSSSGTVFNYYPGTTAAAPTTYLLMAYNTSGNGSATTPNYYCYASSTGGSIVNKTTGTYPSAWAATC